jgi:hypothetical protein
MSCSVNLPRKTSVCSSLILVGSADCLICDSLVPARLASILAIGYDRAMQPKVLVEKWVEAFNRADVEALAAFYADDAVNHQVAENPVVGRTAICEFFAAGFVTAKMVCIVENIFEDGEWAILEWRDPLGLRGCGFFYIVKDKIVFQRGYWDRLSFLRLHGLPILE